MRSLSLYFKRFDLLCFFSALVFYYICEEAMTSERSEGFCLCVCIITVHLQLMWDERSYSASVSTFCHLMPEVIHKPSRQQAPSRILSLLPVMALEGLHLPHLLKIYVGVSFCYDGMWLQRLPAVELSPLSSCSFETIHLLYGFLSFQKSVSCIGLLTGF